MQQLSMGEVNPLQYNGNRCNCDPGQCSDNPMSTMCICPFGYLAYNDICMNKCDINPCGVNAIPNTCRIEKSSRHDYVCDCKKGHIFDDLTGFCINPCENTPCPRSILTGKTGACVAAENSENEAIKYMCECMSGYQWNAEKALCEVSNICVAKNPCGNHTCRISGDPRGYECICNTGYKLHSTVHQCVTYCYEAPCIKIEFGMQGSCKNIDQAPYYSCDCAWGYKWNAEDEDCVDIDECEENLANDVVPCVDNGECVNEEGGYKCTCQDGFVFNENATNDQKSAGCSDCCLDKNECELDPEICEYGGCINETPFYRCNCPFGRKWDAEQKDCIDVDECNDPDQRFCDSENARCVNEEGLYRCECLPGYRLDIEAVQRTLQEGCLDCCVDDDECFYNNPCDHMCENKSPPEKYTCSCKETYKLASNGTSCIHQCKHNTTLCSHNPNRPGDLMQAYIDEGCVPEGDDGLYNCLCADGYRYNDTTAMCTDINECEEDGCDPEKGRCINAVGAFQCMCFEGYANNPNNQSECVDIDECASSKHNCTEICLQGTRSQGAFPGVNYTCGCNPGRYLDDDGYRCFTCQYEAYTEFSECVGKCGVGERIRTRKVKFGHGEKDSRCNDKSFIEETIPCDTLIPCGETTTCEYSDWNHWSECSQECGGGIQKRSKFAIGHVDKCSLLMITEQQICNTNVCPDPPLNITALAMSLSLMGLIIVVILLCLFSCRRSKSKKEISKYEIDYNYF